MIKHVSCQKPKGSQVLALVCECLLAQHHSYFFKMSVLGKKNSITKYSVILKYKIVNTETILEG